MQPSRSQCSLVTFFPPCVLFAFALHARGMLSRRLLLIEGSTSGEEPCRADTPYSGSEVHVLDGAVVADAEDHSASPSTSWEQRCAAISQ